MRPWAPLFLVYSLWTFSKISSLENTNTCHESETGECEWKEEPDEDCSHEMSQCTRHAHLYVHGASAQAYKPNAPLKHTVCDPETYNNEYSKVASWPYTRSWRTPTLMQWKLHLQSCRNNHINQQCCCHPLKYPSSNSSSSIHHSTTNHHHGIMVDVWQTRPDGSYSSLRPNVDEGDCRARLSSSDLSWTSVLPGSTGALQGLGPWDLPPYGPPVVHLLVTAPGHQQLLVDIPVLVSSRTKERQDFSWTDWRGSAWVQSVASNQLAYELTQWTVVDAAVVQVDATLYLVAGQLDDDDDPASSLCPSLVHGHPQAFFREPLAVCARPLLDWFAL